MKFNLKERRRMIKDDEEIQGLEKRDIIAGYEEWFEGFEKELREWLDVERQNHETGIAMEECRERGDLLSHSWGRMQLLKQILGVEPKIKEETKSE